MKNFKSFNFPPTHKAFKCWIYNPCANLSCKMEFNMNCLKWSSKKIFRCFFSLVIILACTFDISLRICDLVSLTWFQYLVAIFPYSAVSSLDMMLIFYTIFNMKNCMSAWITTRLILGGFSCIFLMAYQYIPYWIPFASRTASEILIRLFDIQDMSAIDKQSIACLFSTAIVLLICISCWLLASPCVKHNSILPQRFDATRTSNGETTMSDTSFSSSDSSPNSSTTENGDASLTDAEAPPPDYSQVVNTDQGLPTYIEWVNENPTKCSKARQAASV